MSRRNFDAFASSSLCTPLRLPVFQFAFLTILFLFRHILKFDINIASHAMRIRVEPIRNVVNRVRLLRASVRRITSVIRTARVDPNAFWTITVRGNKAACTPTPCGPNSQCREVGNSLVYSCIAGYLGAPPECPPECVSNSECPPTQACMSLGGRDPCPGTCGQNAECRVINHNPMCGLN